MDTRQLLVCPDINLEQTERIEALESIISSWIHSGPFNRLIRLFGGSTSFAGTLKEQIEYYNNFANVWDYRKQRANGGERWLVTEDRFLSDHKSEIMDCMYLLGLVDVTESKQQPDYILPLGGARMANLDRCLTANEVYQMYREKSIPIVALTGMRPINDIEKESLKKYAPEAQTEYEAICGGIEKAFDLPVNLYTELIHPNDNINLIWAERSYDYDKTIINVLSAPSSDPKRRANSMDTFEFFLKQYDPKTGAKILLITSPIYVPFQLMKFTDLAIERGFYVDCIGNKSYDHTPKVLNTASYLQELKATINAINVLACKFFR